MSFGSDGVSHDTGDFIIRDGKGRTVPHRPLREPLRAHLECVRRQHEGDPRKRAGSVALPDTLARQSPGAAKELHRQRIVKGAVRRAGLAKPATCQGLRHSFATPMPEAGHDIGTIQELLGHSDVRTTMIHTRVLNRGGQSVCSSRDASPSGAPPSGGGS